MLAINQETVSVIIPAYNAEKTIIRCLNSIIEQTYCNVEIIVVDDGSTDNTLKEIEKITEGTNVLVIDQENKGVSEARNIGIRSATGKFIMFCDSDDYLNENAIEQLVLAMHRDDTDLVIGGHYIEKYTGDVLTNWGVHTHCQNICKSIDEISGVFSELMKIDEYFLGTIWGKLFLRRLIVDNRISFSDESCYEDAVFLWKYLRYSSRVSIINIPFYHYYIQRNAGSALQRRKRMDLYLGILSYENAFHQWCIEKKAATEFIKHMYTYFLRTELVLLKKPLLSITDPSSSKKEMESQLNTLMRSEEFMRILEKNGTGSRVCRYLMQLIKKKQYRLSSIFIRYKVRKAK